MLLCGVPCTATNALQSFVVSKANGHLAHISTMQWEDFSLLIPMKMFGLWLLRDVCIGGFVSTQKGGPLMAPTLG